MSSINETPVDEVEGESIISVDPENNKKGLKAVTAFLDIKVISVILLLVGTMVFVGFYLYAAKQSDKTLKKANHTNEKIITSVDKPQPSKDIVRQESKPNDTTINDIQIKLAKIEDELKVIEQNNNSEDVNKIASKLSGNINDIKQYIGAEVGQSVKDNHQDTVNRLEKLQSDMLALTQELAPKHYADPSNLPFKVVAIDSIQQQPVVSVRYAHKVIPLEKHFSLAGWSLLQADFQGQTAEFVDGNNQHVLVRLS